MSISIYKRDTKWRADVIVNGKRKSSTKRTKAEAKAWALEIERELSLEPAAMAVADNAPIITVREAFELYRDTETIKKITSKKETQRINYFLEVLPNVDWPIDKYESDFLAQYIKDVTTRPHKPLSAGSVLRDFSTLSAIFNWCRLEKKWIKINPATEVKKPEKPEHRDRRISVEELERIIVHLGYEVGTVPQTKMQETALIWIIAIATGMRSGEIVNRQLAEVRVHDRQVIIPKGKSKNGGKRIIPLDETAAKLWFLAMQIKRNPRSRKVFTLSDSSRDALFRKARKAAGLDDVDLTFHDSRHEAASLMARRIQNALTLCKIFGWKDPKYALVYYNPTAEEMIEELNQSAGLSAIPALSKINRVTSPDDQAAA
jgi:integrase